MKGVLFLNIEGGLISVNHKPGLRAVDISSTADLEKEFWKLARGVYKGINTVVIDSMTEMQTLNLEEIVERQLAEGYNKSKSGKQRRVDDIWQEDYGESTTTLKRIVRKFRHLPMHVIITALAKYVYPKVPQGTDLTNVEPLAVMPSLTAKLGTSVMGYVDYVWYTYYDPEEKQVARRFKALTRPQETYKAKTRGPNFQKAIGTTIVAPHMDTIYRLLVESQGGSLTPTNRTDSK
jgi:hypothetical protein